MILTLLRGNPWNKIRFGPKQCCFLRVCICICSVNEFLSIALLSFGERTHISFIPTGSPKLLTSQWSVNGFSARERIGCCSHRVCVRVCACVYYNPILPNTRPPPSSPPDYLLTISCHYSMFIDREVIVGKKPIRWAGQQIIEVMIGAVQRQLIVME